MLTHGSQNFLIRVATLPEKNSANHLWDTLPGSFCSQLACHAWWTHKHYIRPMSSSTGHRCTGCSVPEGFLTTSITNAMTILRVNERDSSPLQTFLSFMLSLFIMTINNNFIVLPEIVAWYYCCCVRFKFT